MVAQQAGSLGPSQSAESITPLQYPDRFFAAALYAGFDPQSSLEPNSSRPSLSDDTSLLLYALYQQATVGPCNVAKPWSWNVTENAKWTSWNQLAKMPHTEAMWLFVRTLEEEDPTWWKKSQHAKTPSSDKDPVQWLKEHDEEITASDEPPTPAGAQTVNPEQSVETSPEKNVEIDAALISSSVKTSVNGAASLNGLSSLNGALSFDETKAEKIILDTDHENGKPYKSWSSPGTFGRVPAARYQHTAAVVGNSMYVIGGNHNGRYLGDVQELNLDTLTWSKVEQKLSSISSREQSTVLFPPCAGHSVILWDGMLVTVAGHSKEPSDEVTVRAFDPATSSWSLLPCYGQAPVARGGQTVTKVGNTLIMFGGEDAKRRLYNDLNILDLETMTWDAVEGRGIPPSPRSDHTAAVYDDHYFFVFGGGSHSSCFNDLHILDLENMEWSKPQQHGFTPSPRAGHAGVTIGPHWYIVGGGDNKRGISDTLMLNMSTLVWHVVATENGRTPIASEGLSVVASVGQGAASLISFGGYNGQYSNEVHIFKTDPLKKAKVKVLHSPAAEAAAVSAAAAFSVSQSQTPRSTSSVDADAVPDDTPSVILESAPEIPLELQPQDVEYDISNDISLDKAESAAPLISEDLSLTSNLQVELKEAQSEASKFKQELAASLQENLDLEKELVAVRGQLAAEQSRCFRLEVDIAELRQKLQAMNAVQTELDLVRQRAAAEEEAALNVSQKPVTSVWSWLAGDQKSYTSVTN